MPFRIAQIVSKTLLSAALALLVLFHFLPPGVGNGRLVGWRIWVELWETIERYKHPWAYGELVSFSLFLIPMVLIAASPFLGRVWIKSWLAWCLVVVISGMAAGFFWLTSLVVHAAEISAGGWCLIVAPTLNLAGLLLARAGVREPGEL